MRSACQEFYLRFLSLLQWRWWSVFQYLHHHRQEWLMVQIFLLSLLGTLQQLQNPLVSQSWTKALPYHDIINVKFNFCREKYISQLLNVYVYPLIKFRCRSRELPIETGRSLGEYREKRMSKECIMGIIGDDFHFVLECPMQYTDMNWI